jgi:hypothetical protein
MGEGKIVRRGGGGGGALEELTIANQVTINGFYQNEISKFDNVFSKENDDIGLIEEIGNVSIGSFLRYLEFTKDNQYLIALSIPFARTSGTLPSLEVYKWNDTSSSLTKLPDPDLLPLYTENAGGRDRIAVSYDSKYIVVGDTFFNENNNLIVYKIEGNTFSNLPDNTITYSTSNSNIELSFSPKGNYFVAYSASSEDPKYLNI